MLESRTYIGCRIAFRLLKHYLVGLGDLLANPACEVLGRCVEFKKIVEILVIQLPYDALFEVREVGHHPIGIQLFRAAIDGDDAVVSMQPPAFAFVVQPQLVGIGYFDAFLYEVHGVCLIKGCSMNHAG